MDASQLVIGCTALYLLSSIAHKLTTIITLLRSIKTYDE